MAATYTVSSINTTFSANKCMISLFNESASTKVVRVYRMFVFNNTTAVVTGVLTNLEIRRLSAASGGNALTPVSHDSNNAALSNITCATNATVTPTDLFRRLIWSTDETSVAAFTIDELETFAPICTVWQTGYGDDFFTPLTIRPNEGVAIINTGARAGFGDFIMEFTVEDS
jgi:hypothetical protein